jgi:hypothetical protein
MMPVALTAGLVWAGLVWAAGVGDIAITATQTPTRVDVSARAVVSALSRYVAAYQQQFALLVADEEYTQELHTVDGATRTRLMRGELFLTYLEADGAWTAVHDFSEVDGMALDDREDLRSLLGAGSMTSIARRLVDRNARFNLGSVTRNFNEPTLALQVANARRVSSFRFSVEAVDRSDPAGPVVTLTFRERDRPTLVRSARGEPIYARGSLVVEAASGRVRQTHIIFDDAPVLAELQTAYAAEPRLGLWVPSTWTERYSRSEGLGREIVTGRSTYSNYRRFEVTGRIK